MAMPAANWETTTPAGVSLHPPEQLDCPPTDAEIATTPSSPVSPSPVHPIAQLQGPFEESIAEATQGQASEWIVSIDAQTRRRDLLENDEYERLCGRKWRQRSTEKYHPFWKLVSQIVFGAHLLAKRQAKSPAAVMQILQGHVNEIDGFLQRTTEDFLIIHLDVRTRIQYLTLPLGNLALFDEMLEDRNFRLALVSYNDQIEHAVERFTLAITDALKDLRKGKDAMGALWHYLQQLGNEGCFETDYLRAFSQTMLENMEGWLAALSKLRRRGIALQKALSQLALAVIEMQRRVGVASRKDVRSFVQTPVRAPSRSMSVRQRLFSKSPGPGTPGRRSLSDKPLPRDPFSKPPPSRPFSRNLDEPSRRNSLMPRVINRAKSCSALVGETGTNTVDNDRPTPSRTPSRLTRRLSRPFLPKRSASDKTAATTTGATPNRPSTAPAQTLKPRSTSIEQLKALWAPNGRPRTQQSMANPATGMTPTPTSRPQTRSQPQSSPPKHLPSDHLDTMKDQISQFLKTDRVVEAWDSIAKTATCCGTTLAKTKEWPSSIFQAKSSENLHGHGSLSRNRSRSANGNANANAFSETTNLQRQMSWVQEPEFLNTISFKQRPASSPRIHVLSVAVDDELEKSFSGCVSASSTATISATTNTTGGGGGGAAAAAGDVRGHIGDEGFGGETGSIITALPAVPAPDSPSTPSSTTKTKTTKTSARWNTMPAVGYRPRTIGVQA